MSRNKIGDELCDYCCEILAELQLETLNLAVNAITIKGLSKLCASLWNSSCKHLCLDSNKFNFDETESKTASLISKNF